MMIKFTSHGSGSGKGAVDYLLQSHDHKGEERESVTVMKGSPEPIAELIDSLEFSKKYSSAVIAWHKDDKPTQEQINLTLSNFEKMAFAGLDKDQYTMLAVQHGEKDGGVHVHVLIPRVELSSGKSFNPAPPGWEKSFGPVRDVMNNHFDWKRPDAPENRRMFRPGHFAHLDKNDNPKEVINQFIADRIESGQIHNRDDVIESLKEIGDITRAGKDYVTVKIGDDRYRMKGAVYDKQFNVESHLESRESPEATNSSDSEARSKRTEEASQLFAEAAEKRAIYNIERYPRVEQEDQKSVDAKLVADSDSLSSYLDSSLGDLAVSITPNQEQSDRARTPESNTINHQEADKESADLALQGRDRVAVQEVSTGALHSDNRRSESDQILSYGEERNERTRELIPKFNQVINDKARSTDSDISEIKSGINRSESKIDDFIRRANEAARQQLQAIKQYYEYVADLIRRTDEYDSEELEQQRERDKSISRSGDEVSKSEQSISRLEDHIYEQERDNANAIANAPKPTRAREYEM